MLCHNFIWCALFEHCISEALTARLHLDLFAMGIPDFTTLNELAGHGVILSTF